MIGIMYEAGSVVKLDKQAAIKIGPAQFYFLRAKEAERPRLSPIEIAKMV